MIYTRDLCSILLFVALMKYLDQFWEFISYYKLCPSLKEARAGAQDRNLEAGIEAETKEDCSLLACFP